MITGLNHVCIFVLDHEVAKQFYVDTLGFEVRTDASFGEGQRWLTVGPKAQPELEIVLGIPEMTTTPEIAVQIRELVAKGAFGCGVLESNDIHKDYAELSAKGVEFKGPPKDEFYGIEAVMKDPFGNWFSMTQRKPH